MGNRIEEVKKILKKITMDRNYSYIAPKDIDRAASEICQLFGVPLVEVDVLAKREAGWRRLNTAATVTKKGD